ncbi:hypothetical protein L195_g014564 [Trifolium pratense]|uniref:Uncharacterized protein n=1 Tax=Trifolium pratense TaxID=57577 RepID=A0A2K3PR97_TRIPR|nr:hypothetical protein L195_g014564 [Trifolium pratense]
MLFIDRVTGLEGAVEDVDVESTGGGFGKGLGEVVLLDDWCGTEVLPVGFFGGILGIDVGPSGYDLVVRDGLAEHAKVRCWSARLGEWLEGLIVKVEGCRDHH